MMLPHSKKRDVGIVAGTREKVNSVMAVLGGLALLIEPPSEKLMEKPPTRPTEPLITKSMWRNIIIQASYQVSILVPMVLGGHSSDGGVAGDGAVNITWGFIKVKLTRSSSLGGSELP
ncbi:hypothetical protein OIU76_021641 [Salix suchowensis]|nr:hypothetical protein OIU76_021641 [Salix suchowensis]